MLYLNDKVEKDSSNPFIVELNGGRDDSVHLKVNIEVAKSWINDEGFVCDQEGYIILASVDLDPYTIVETPFGYMGKVYDTGCPHGILDVYTNW